MFRRTGRVGADHGSATVWVLAAGLVVLLVATTLAGVGAATVARHRAQAAADLAALAAALRAFEGESVACSRASDMTGRNGARLVACRLEGFDAIVTVAAGWGPGGGGWGEAQASARAGPVD